MRDIGKLIIKCFFDKISDIGLVNRQNVFQINTIKLIVYVPKGTMS